MAMSKTTEVCIVPPGTKAHVDMRNNFSWSSYLIDYKEKDFERHFDGTVDSYFSRNTDFSVSDWLNVYYDDFKGVFFKIDL